MALSSSSTIAEIEAQLIDNIDFDDNPEAARSFVVAARIWLLRQPSQISRGGASIQLNPAEVRAMLDRANFVVAANASQGYGPLYFSIENFRD